MKRPGDAPSVGETIGREAFLEIPPARARCAGTGFRRTGGR
jgi:hypothetical protein